MQNYIYIYQTAYYLSKHFLFYCFNRFVKGKILDRNLGKLLSVNLYNNLVRKLLVLLLNLDSNNLLSP